MKRYISIFLVMLTLVLLFVNWVDFTNTHTQNVVFFGKALDEVDILYLTYHGMPETIIELYYDMLYSEAMSPFALVVCGVMTELSNSYVTGALVATLLSFVLLIFLLLKLLVQHVFGRRAHGYGTWILIVLLFIAFSSLSAAFGGELTPAGFVAVGAMLASCILWGQHVKAVGVKKGRYTLKEAVKCPKCGAATTDESNMFCEKCNALMDSSL